MWWWWCHNVTGCGSYDTSPLYHNAQARRSWPWTRSSHGTFQLLQSHAANAVLDTETTLL